VSVGRTEMRVHAVKTDGLAVAQVKETAFGMMA
jgi:hypothetical protein